MSYGAEERAREDYSTESDYEVRDNRLRKDGPSFSDRANRLLEAASAASDALDGLAVKLEPVLGPMRPSPAIGGVNDVAESSDLARLLTDAGDRFDSLRERIRDLTRRAEL